MRDSKTEFTLKVPFYHQNALELRNILSEETFKQARFIRKNFKPDLTPNPKYINLFKDPFEPAEDNDISYFFLEEFGIKLKSAEVYQQLPSMEKEITPPKEVIVESMVEVSDNFDPLGLGFSLGGIGSLEEEKDVKNEEEDIKEDAPISVEETDVSFTLTDNEITTQKSQVIDLTSDPQNITQSSEPSESESVSKRSADSSSQASKKVRFNV
ncbi:hypothetical protein CANTEDRAFT_114187 [Yamadazyma tenuis ATCC 10573]|uniref:Uncharacterized protein n=3 Tax=Candida tenuis TaxID=2315449 RepID=G3B3F8_CANTC|nr:uncharacterized protein CANTEDRAFT_114187 [Yamadazyma tenuis ATCC 10573]XP_006686704.1 uncharacterized protein CANTEDRAFT_114187 [Yamadazyma tenuis ATCC 10573]EGV64389.1 hypothetical protein CANTEDRAFT_114187 [Yamadazyma tenuis ATCC 10573]EGV64390.1 hypothetical protein CANTEDRAFT_114187 [Yamadazyma tenuis ATCC 10573]